MQGTLTQAVFLISCLQRKPSMVLPPVYGPVKSTCAWQLLKLPMQFFNKKMNLNCFSSVVAQKLDIKSQLNWLQYGLPVFVIFLLRFRSSVWKLQHLFVRKFKIVSKRVKKLFKVQTKKNWTKKVFLKSFKKILKGEFN